jgi:hypothetical protein
MQITNTYTGPKKVVAQFVADILRNFADAYVSITITPRGRFADCSVSTVIDISSEDTVETLARSYSKLRSTTYRVLDTPDG